MNKYILPIVTLRFSDEKDYPYEWLSPYYVSHIRVRGVYYPTVAHYVAAKLATPAQFRNVSPRDWIQKERVSYDSSVKDRYTHPKDYYRIEEIVEALPDRIQEVYNMLYLRYASRALDVKLKGYPFRQILFETGKKRILYRDENNRNAIAGKDVAKILTDIRNDIKNVQILTPLPNPVYGKENLALTNYIQERTRELLRGIVLFARYRMSPRPQYINVNNIPIIGFDDAIFIVQKLYLSCRDINYNEYVSDPPERYVIQFESDFRDLLKLYFSGRTVYDTRHPDVQDAIRMKLSGKSEDTMEDKLFVSFEEIMKFIWVHIVQVCILLEEELPENYDQNQLKQRIKSMRGKIYTAKLGTGKEVAVNAAVNIFSQLHLFFPEQPRLEDSDVFFLQDFIYPLNLREPTISIPESESYNTYPMLLERVTDIYSGVEQNLQTIKKLASVLDGFIGIPEEENILFNKITIRLKFFASQA